MNTQEKQLLQQKHQQQQHHCEAAATLYTIVASTASIHTQEPPVAVPAAEQHAMRAKSTNMRASAIEYYAVCTASYAVCTASSITSRGTVLQDNEMIMCTSNKVHTVAVLHRVMLCIGVCCIASCYALHACVASNTATLIANSSIKEHIRKHHTRTCM
eukprot:17578-Heterococcus_DN1.PRE.5